MTLGGRAAEEIVFGEITTGASNDLEKVTATAKQMVMRFGMSEKLGPRVFGHDHGQPFLGREFSAEPDYSDEIAREIDDEIRRIVEAAHQQRQGHPHRAPRGARRRSPRSSSSARRSRSEEFEALLDGKTEEEVFGPDDVPSGGTPELPGCPRPPTRRPRGPAPAAAPRPRRRRGRGARPRRSRRSPNWPEPQEGGQTPFLRRVGLSAPSGRGSRTVDRQACTSEAGAERWESAVQRTPCTPSSSSNTRTP